MIHALPQSHSPNTRTDLPHGEGAADILRQALAGFLPPTTALFHFFDRMETHK